MAGFTRRKFIQTASASGTFLVLGFLPGESRNVLTSDPDQVDLNQFISIDSKGVVTLFNHRPEMGQGTYQSIPMILAEELEVDIDKVQIKQSVASRKLYGSQMVVGSRSIQTEYQKLRKMGASAREVLKQAAANHWGIDINDCQASGGKVIRFNGKSLSYGELVTKTAGLKPPQDPPLKDPSDFKVLGQPIPRRDIPLKTNGEAQFGIDVKVPGMLYASVERSRTFQGEIKSYQDQAALNVPGVKKVVVTKRNMFGRDIAGIAVLADNYWAALQGRKALKIQWDHGGLEQISDETIEKDSMEAAKLAGDQLFGRGNSDQVFDNSDEVFEQYYETPYQAHVPMEPMNAIVHIGSAEAEFWGSTQNPNGMRTFISEKYGIPEDKIKINYTFMGGGFGRRSRTDVVEEAADLSKQVGAPVKLIWTREDDQTQGPFRTCSLNLCRGVLAKDGSLKAMGTQSDCPGNTQSNRR